MTPAPTPKPPEMVVRQRGPFILRENPLLVARVLRERRVAG